MNVPSSPLISVVIPVYNGSDYIAEAADSALNQTYPHVEVIIVNDGSSDDGKTEAVCAAYGKRVRYIAKENGGVASALNVGIKAMTGEFFTWLPHDDVCLPIRLEKQIRTLLAAPDPENAVVYARHGRIDSRGESLGDAPFWEPFASSKELPFRLLAVPALHACNFLCHKNLLLRFGGFREDLPTTQDYDLLFKIAMVAPFIEIPEVLLLARTHEGQGSATQAHLDEVEGLLSRHIPSLSAAYLIDTFGESGCIRELAGFAAILVARNYPGPLLKIFFRTMACLRPANAGAALRLGAAILFSMLPQTRSAAKALKK